MLVHNLEVSLEVVTVLSKTQPTSLINEKMWRTLGVLCAEENTD